MSRLPSTSPAATSIWPTASGSRCAPGRSGWSSGRAAPDPDLVDLGRVTQDHDVVEAILSDRRIWAIKRPTDASELAGNDGEVHGPGRTRGIPRVDRFRGQVEHD